MVKIHRDRRLKFSMFHARPVILGVITSRDCLHRQLSATRALAKTIMSDKMGCETLDRPLMLRERDCKHHMQLADHTFIAA